MNPKKRPLPSPDADLLPACNQCRSRKVRCDRVQPECSTCRKTNVPCDFSASFKRVNPAKQLLHDFSTVLARLDHVDRTLTQLSQKVDALSPQSTGAALTTTTGTAWPEPANDGAAEEIVTKQVLELGDIGERLYGYPAALCLFRSSQKLLWTALGGYPNIAPLPGAVAMAADQPSLRPSLVRHYEIFPFRGKCIELPLVRDQSPILLPPLAVLESAVPSYLENINSQVPVFDADSLHAAIQTCYQTPNSVIGSIWAVCFNCIVLLAWNLEARVAQRVKSLVDPWDNKGITALLLSNCRRGLADLQRFSQPALGSLQALILLTLVAREFFVSAVFEKACQTSCHVARSMGLGRSIETLDHVEDSVQLRTRERLFWALYSLDKQRVFLSGHSCDLYLFDSGLQPPRCSSEMPATSQLQFASVQMMTIWEEIYLCLYSSRAARFRVDHRRDQIRALRRLYADFSRQQEELLSSSFLTRAPDLGMMQLELRYRYHVGQILIYRCDPSEESQKETRKHSVLALRMISDVFHAPVTANSCAVLSRMFQYSPLIAFHDLCVVYLTNTTSDETASYVTLLGDVREQLDSLRHPTFPTNYVAKLHQGVTWCTDLVDLVKQAVWTPESSESSHCVVTPPAATCQLPGISPTGFEGLLARPVAYPFDGMDLPDFFFDPLLMENYFADQFRVP